MPSYQSVFKDTTPAIVYSSEWRAVSSEDDPLLDQYGQATATFSNTTGATMTLRFFGNNVGIYGSKRPDHGLFNVTIDGNTYPTLNGSSPSPLFNQTLFNTTLDNGPHTMVLTNIGNTTLDVDYLALNAFVGTPDETLGSDTFQDDHPNFQYTGNWVATQRPGTYSGSSAHITRDPEATVRHTFQGITYSLDRVSFFKR
ncbi:hypothetical protein CVT24_004246 [Panaeolus cyanescens]|uniref:Uncharacterized protein n=1 Tax=Panaeolus cyanescens TaxID=181874 RepID=A0A409VEL8_9AGAR|nr:hypothetical protein CVT24_004246 [Panaeolus cyanescens]